MNKNDVKILQEGLEALPLLKDYIWMVGENGESVFDVAGIWKRVLNHRISKYYGPKRILETHAGIGLSSLIYKNACPSAEIISLTDCTLIPKGDFDLVDIDPSGAPWVALDHVSLSCRTILMVSSGEAMMVQRGLNKSMKYPTTYKGKDLPKWIIKDYLPLLEELTHKQVRFFYCYPSTVRVVLSDFEMPSDLFEGCPQWMSWLSKYV